MLRPSLLAALLMLSAACGAPTRCGPGTQLQGDVCVIVDGGSIAASDSGTDAGSDAGTSMPDAGAGAELPSTAIISPVKVMQGFADCPTITLGYSDGRSLQVVLDPTYRVPLGNAVRLVDTGLTLEWASPGGLARTGVLPTCGAAVIGLLPGAETMSLKVSNGVQARVIGSAALVVVALPASGVTLQSLRIDTVASGLAAMYRLPISLQGPTRAPVPLGETRSLFAQFDITATGVSMVSFIPVPEYLTLTFSDPAVLEPVGGRVRGKSVGVTTITASYTTPQRTLGTANTEVWVSDSVQTVDLSFEYPTTDDGFVLPTAHRYADTVPVGTCFNLEVYAATSGIEPGATQPSGFERVATAHATFSTAGSGLTQTTGKPNRFCATQAGEAAVRVCDGGVCSTLGVVVVATTDPVAVSLEATMPLEVHLMSFMWTSSCVPLQLTARVGTAAPIDITNSPSLRFDRGSNPTTFYVDYAADGLPRRDPGTLCFQMQSTGGNLPSGLRVFWGGGQTILSTVLKY